MAGASFIVYGGLGPRVQSPAGDLVNWIEWYRSQGDARLDGVVERALAADPDCIEALVAKATNDFDPGEAGGLTLLKHAVLVGSRLWKDVEQEWGVGRLWWEVPGTRPYMMAIYELGRFSEAAGDTATAVHCYQSLLRMYDRDPIGARFDLERLSASPPVARA